MGVKGCSRRPPGADRNSFDHLPKQWGRKSTLVYLKPFSEALLVSPVASPFGVSASLLVFFFSFVYSL